MKLIKWFGYFSLLGLFIWFVFLRNIDNQEVEIESTSTNQSQEDDLSIDSSIEEEFLAMDDFEESTDVEEPELQEDEYIDFEPDTVEEFAPSYSDGIDPNNKYLIVIGSFGEKRYAEAMLERIMDKGIDGTIVLVNNMHRVVTASSNDQADAINLRDHFTHSLNETAFVLINY